MQENEINECPIVFIKFLKEYIHNIYTKSINFTALICNIYKIFVIEMKEQKLKLTNIIYTNLIEMHNLKIRM